MTEESEDLPTLRPHDRIWLGPLIVCGLTLLMQFALVSTTFPLKELTSKTPLLYIDSPYHWYRMKLAVNMAATRQGIGFDPYFGAGYSAGATMDMSAQVLAALAKSLNVWLDEIVIYKLWVFFAAVIGPICVPFAASRMGLSTKTVAISGVFGGILWWVSVFRWYHTAGMVSFVLAAYLCLPYLALLLQLFKNDSWRTTFLLGVFGAIGLFLHPAFPIPIAFWTITYIAFCWRELKKSVLIKALIVIPVISLLPNLIWIISFLRTGVDNTAPYQALVDINLIWQELGARWNEHAHGSKIYAPLVLSTLWAVFCAARREEITISRVMSITSVALVLYAAIGAAAGAVQPNRFAPVAYLLLCVPAAIGVVAMLRIAMAGTGGLRVSAARLSLLLIALPFLYSINELRREISFDDVGRYAQRPPEVSGVGPYSKWIMTFLQTETQESGRILFELSKGRLYDNAHMAPNFAYLTNREFIGGPYPFFALIRTANYWDGSLFGRPIAEISTEEFDRYIGLYNIGWIIAHSEESKSYFDRLPFVIPVDSYKEFKSYRVTRPLNYFMVGNGTVRQRDHNHLWLSNLSGDEIILKYHFIPGLETVPATKVEPVKLAGDTDPFIRIVNPPRELVLTVP